MAQEARENRFQDEASRLFDYADQTRLFSREEWKPMRFTERAIRLDPQFLRRVVTGRR